MSLYVNNGAHIVTSEPARWVQDVHLVDILQSVLLVHIVPHILGLGAGAGVHLADSVQEAH